MNPIRTEINVNQTHYTKTHQCINQSNQLNKLNDRSTKPINQPNHIESTKQPSNQSINQIQSNQTNQSFNQTNQSFNRTTKHTIKHSITQSINQNTPINQIQNNKLSNQLDQTIKQLSNQTIKPIFKHQPKQSFKQNKQQIKSSQIDVSTFQPDQATNRSIYQPDLQSTNRAISPTIKIFQQIIKAINHSIKQPMDQSSKQSNQIRPTNRSQIKQSFNQSKPTQSKRTINQSFKPISHAKPT